MMLICNFRNSCTGGGGEGSGGDNEEEFSGSVKIQRELMNYLDLYKTSFLFIFFFLIFFLLFVC